MYKVIYMTCDTRGDTYTSFDLTLTLTDVSRVIASSASMQPSMPYVRVAVLECCGIYPRNQSYYVTIFYSGLSLLTLFQY